MSLSVVEYFTQRGALDRLARDPVPADSPSRVMVERARQKRDAAEALVSVSMSESYLLIRDAVSLFAQALDQLGAGDTLSAKLTSLGVSPAGQVRVTRALEEALKRPFPNVDSAVRDEDGDTYRELSEAAPVLACALNGKLLSKRDLKRRRFWRVSIAVATALFLFVGLPLLLRPPAATASAIFSEAFKPEMAIDGKLGTEWILPDSSAGWMDVRVSPARSIHMVRVSNGHNREHNDYAIKAYRLEAYRGDKLLTSASREFTTVTPEPPHEVPLVADKVDRVRIVVISWFAHGAALAEIKVE